MMTLGHLFTGWPTVFPRSNREPDVEMEWRPPRSSRRVRARRECPLEVWDPMRRPPAPTVESDLAHDLRIHHGRLEKDWR